VERSHPAGLSHWKFGRFDLYSVNPPLVRTLAAAPVYMLGNDRVDWSLYRSDPSMRSEVFLGRQMIELGGEDAVDDIFMARLALIPVALLGGLLCFFWARDLFGPKAGLVALGIWVFSPNVLAYGSLITPDLASAVAMLAAAYVFWRWQREPTWPWAMLLASTLAVAMLTKSVWLLLPPLFMIIWGLRGAWYVGVAMRKRMRQTEPGGHRTLPSVSNARIPTNLQPGVGFAQLGVACLLSFVFTNAFYGFERSFYQLEGFSFVSRSFAGPPSEHQLEELRPDPDCPECEERGRLRAGIPGNRFASSLLGKIPVPLPAAYLQGIDLQFRDFERGYYDANWMSFLFGNWRQGGWWYYYLVGLFVKVPIPVWGLLLASLVLGCQNATKHAVQWTGLACLCAPAIVLLILVSSATGVNRYVRYALPVLPVLFIGASQLAERIRPGNLTNGWSRRLAWGFFGMCGGWLIASTLWYSPHYLSYFNEAAGGPSRGHLILSDSNVDWGQDLLYLKKWMQSEPLESTRELHLAYFGSYNPKAIGIDFELPQPLDPQAAEYPAEAQRWYGPTPGLHIVSKNFVIGSTMPVPTETTSLHFAHFDFPPFGYFSEFDPVDCIGHSMFVYRLSLEEVNQVRRRHGLVELRKVPQTNLPSGERLVDGTMVDATNVLHDGERNLDLR
jgi:hypothetical protein